MPPDGKLGWTALKARDGAAQVAPPKHVCVCVCVATCSHWRLVWGNAANEGLTSRC